MRIMGKLLSFLAFLLLLVGSPAFAHEGHKADMSDAELAQMRAQPANARQATPAGAASQGTMAMEHAHGVAPDAAAPAAADNHVKSLGDFLGRLHPMLVHVPIGLLMAALLAELLFIWKPMAGFGIVVRFLAVGGALGAVAAALLGWFSAGWRLHDRSDTLMAHRWNGTTIAAVSIAAAMFAFRANRTPLRILLVFFAIALPIQGYLGAEMVYGPNHLGL
ncbi:DUF2231 domain-containing protein [Sphingomonas lycopersici]|uniref:DUF2231 domain-containing protein n=1 Tax=Sphingomonas lycopersici TaxID=2951807 RepID=UPI0032C4A4FE